jgi:hypothetical protein
LEFRSLEGEPAAADTKCLVVGQTCHGDVVGLVWANIQGELTLDLRGISLGYG